jgi:hypothetical protein
VSGALTFAEAMALDPSEVEVKHRGEWGPLERPNSPSGEFFLSWLRTAEFRKKARPMRSRVQEMAAVMTGDSGTIPDYRARFGEQLIRAVCAYLETKRAVSGDNHLAELVERHFLEPQ